MPLLEVRDLAVSFATPDGLVQAVRGLSFDVAAGRTLGIIGESGSGKSVSALSLLGLVRGARVCGTARFEGEDLLGMSETRLRQVRGAGIAMIFQDPLSSLHPYFTVGWQIAEMIRTHQDLGARAARAEAVELLRMVGIPRPQERVDQYPHQFSGGMRQRVMIAMALALRPRLLIADEPTTALDATVQAQILALLRAVQQETGSGLIMITHDLGVVAEMADEVLVMYAGRAVETASRRAAFYRPHHPYTVGLLESLPAAGRRGMAHSIPGQPPSLINPPAGCAFRPRCRYRMPICTASPPLADLREGDAHRSACWLPIDLLGASAEVAARRTAAARAAIARANASRGSGAHAGAAPGDTAALPGPEDPPDAGGARR